MTASTNKGQNRSLFFRFIKIINNINSTINIIRYFIIFYSTPLTLEITISESIDKF